MDGGTNKYCGCGLLFFLILSCGIVSALPPGFCLPDDNSIALGVFAPKTTPSGEEQILLEEIQDFKAASEKIPAIVVLSDEWMNDRDFPISGATTLRNEGMIPYIRFMMRSSDKPYQQEPVYTLKNIALGKFDGELRAWARDARSFGSPILIEYGTEVNQWSYPWNGYWNGNEKGQKLFQDAYRHIVETMREEGASNLIWIYHTNDESQPNESWNNLTKYYPGDAYIDLVAISLYGSKKPFEMNTKEFKTSMDRVYTSLDSASINKPILLITGTDVRNQHWDPGTWITDVLGSLSQNLWPRIKGLIWLNAAWKNDDNSLHDTSMRLQDNASASDIFSSNLKKMAIKEQLNCSYSSFL